jgi:hypothetical protein
MTMIWERFGRKLCDEVEVVSPTKENHGNPLGQPIPGVITVEYFPDAGLECCRCANTCRVRMSLPRTKPRSFGPYQSCTAHS